MSYDAPSNSYTISTAGRSQTFGPADVSSSDSTQVIYSKTDGVNRDHLTLVTSPYSGSATTKYVDMGYWQRDVITGSTQDLTFDIFTYGLDTPATGVPRTGQASFDTSVFGVTTTPGFQPRTFEGGGRFDVDFGLGVFTTNTMVTETELVSGQGVSGGGIELSGGGQLSSSDGTFSGSVHYGGANANASGSLSGRFYGPNGQELGASFSASGTDGSAVTGALTGTLDSTATPINLSLTNIITDQLFFTSEQILTTSTGGSNGPQVFSLSTGSQLTMHTAGNFSYEPGISSLPGGPFTVADEVASPSTNFVRYQKSFPETTGTGSQVVTLDMYKPGSSNSELALTYTSFGRWSSTFLNGAQTETDQDFFVYGLETPLGVVAGRTGSAQYSGVAYGAGSNKTTGATYDVSGQSSFNVNFSNQTYSGSLALTGSGHSGAVDFGSYSFLGQISASTTASTATLTQGGAASGSLTSKFYGPTGQEIGGTFMLNVLTGHSGAGTQIAGVAVAKQQ